MLDQLNIILLILIVILVNLEAIVDNTLETNQIYHFILQEIEYLNYFGYFLNYLDIAPKYASLISSLLMVAYYTPNILCMALRNIFDSKILNDAETNILKAAICLLLRTLYFIFGSAGIQPWAVDKPVEENQQNLVENEDLPPV